jgi:hypothetical protein
MTNMMHLGRRRPACVRGVKARLRTYLIAAEDPSGPLETKARRRYLCI